MPHRYLAILSGLFYDATARWDRAGPQMTLAIGATLNIAGYLALWAAATGYTSVRAPLQCVLRSMHAPCGMSSWRTG